MRLFNQVAIKPLTLCFSPFDTVTQHKIMDRLNELYRQLIYRSCSNTIIFFLMFKSLAWETVQLMQKLENVSDPAAVDLWPPL